MAASKPTATDVPQLFRLNIEVGDLDRGPLCFVEAGTTYPGCRQHQAAQPPAGQPDPLRTARARPA